MFVWVCAKGIARVYARVFFSSPCAPELRTPPLLQVFGGRQTEGRWKASGSSMWPCIFMGHPHRALILALGPPPVAMAILVQPAEYPQHMTNGLYMHTHTQTHTKLQACCSTAVNSRCFWDVKGIVQTEEDIGLRRLSHKRPWFYHR